MPLVRWVLDFRIEKEIFGINPLGLRDSTRKGDEHDDRGVPNESTSTPVKSFGKWYLALFDGWPTMSVLAAGLGKQKTSRMCVWNGLVTERSLIDGRQTIAPGVVSDVE